MDNKCDCGEDELPFSYEISHESMQDCERRFGVVSIDDIPVGTGRMENGQIVDIEWDAVALAKLGLTTADVDERTH
jgi:hypothetical protein